MVWNISPIAFTLSWGALHWPVYWYGLLFAGAFAYGILFFHYIFRLEGRPSDEVYDLALYFMGGTLIGARLGHVLLYDPWRYLSHPWSLFKVWEGGLASHGALVGILAGVYLFARLSRGLSFLWVADRVGMAVPVSGVLIRIGNFINSEILGTPTDLPWAVVFARADSLPRHPVQLYESLCYLLIFAVLFRDYRQRMTGRPEGWLLGRSLLYIFGTRFVLEFFKESQAVFETGWPITMGQLLSIPAVLAGIYLTRSRRQPVGAARSGRTQYSRRS